MRKNVLFVIIFLLLIVGGLYILVPRSVPHNTDLSSTNNQTPVASEKQTKLFIGNPDSKARIIEYADFKCKSCNQFHRDTGAQIREEYIQTNQAAMEFRTLPFIGPDSYRAAEGAYCANDQQAFLAYHDAVFEYMWDNYFAKGNTAAEFEDILTVDVLTAIAKDIGIDDVMFRGCLNDHTFDAAVKTDLKASEEAVVTGTPTIEISGQTVTGTQPYNIYKTLIDIQLR